MGKKGNQSKDDPLGLNQVDRVIHIEKLKAQIKAIAGEEVTFGTLPNPHPASGHPLPSDGRGTG